LFLVFGLKVARKTKQKLLLY